MKKVKLLLEWVFDQFIYPIWQAIFPSKIDGHDPDPDNPGFRRDGYRDAESSSPRSDV